MTKHRICSIVALFLCAAPAFAATARNHPFRIVAITGDVKIAPPRAATFRPARTGEALLPQTKIRTGRGTAILEISEGNRLYLAENSEIAIDTSKRIAQSRFSIRLDQRSGRVVSILKRLPPQSTFRIHTPVATSGVRGTIYSSRVTAAGTEIQTLEGSVKIGGASVGAGKSLSVTPSGPGQIQSMTPQARSLLKQLADAAMAPRAPPLNKCITGMKVHNGTASDVTVSLAGEGVYMSQRVAARSDKTLTFKPVECVTATVSGAAITSTTGTSSTADYAARLRERNRAQTPSPTTTPQPSGRNEVDARASAENVSASSRAAYEEEQRREAEERARVSSPAQREYPEEEYPIEEEPAAATVSEPRQDEPITPPPTSDAGYRPSQPTTTTEPSTARFSERREICGAGKVQIATNVDITPVTADCDPYDQPDEEYDEHEEEDDDDPRDEDVFDEDYWNELLEAWRKAKEEEDRRLREELERLEQEMKDKQKALDDERERRRRNPQRERNAHERDRLDQERDRLEEERDKIEEDRDRLERDGKTDDQLDKDLREAEQEIRENDPNCRSAECRQIQEERTKLQERRVERMKEGQQVEKRSQAYERDARNLRNDAREYEERLDRGEGLTRDEHKARMERQRYEEARRENQAYRDRHEELRNKHNTRTPEEEAEFRQLDRNLDNFNRQEAEYEQRTADAIEKVNQTQGGSFENHSDFIGRYNFSHSQKITADAPSFDRMNSGELKDRSDRLGEAIDDVENARERIGRGGDQPGEQRAGLDALDKAKAEIDEQQRALDEATARRGALYFDLHGVGVREGADKRVEKIQKELDEARERGATFQERQEIEERLQDAQRDYRQLERDHRAADREVRRIENGLNERITDFNDVTRYQGMADQVSNLVSDYNGSYGNTITPAGQIDANALRDNINRFEQNAREAQEQSARVGALEEMRRNLRAGEGERLGLSGDDIRRHEETLDRQIARAAERRDRALGELDDDGFEGELTPDGKYKVNDAPNWARVFGRASQQVIADERAEQERLARPPPAEPALERVRRAPETGGAGADERRAAMEERERQARERNQAALEGGYEKWREVRDRQRRAELDMLRAVPLQGEEERVARLESDLRKSEEERAVEARRGERMNRVWERWAADVVVERRVEPPRPVAPEAPRTEAPSQLEAERNQHLDEAAAALANLRKNNDVEALRERRNQLERDYMDVEAARLRGERAERPDAARQERLTEQGERIMEQLEAYRLALVRAHEARTESANEVDRRRVAERIAEWADVRAAVPVAPATPPRVARAERPESPPPPSTRERPQPPVTPPPPPPERPPPPTVERATGDTQAAAGGIERPTVTATDEVPADTGRRILTDTGAAARAAREEFKEFVRRTLRGLLERGDPTVEALPEIIANLADRYGAENASKMVVDALARLRDRRSIRGVDVLNALFEQAAVESERANGAEGKRLAQLGHLEFLDALLNDPRLGVVFGITDANRRAIAERIGRIATDVSRSVGEQARAAERAGNLGEELKHLATMLHLANLKNAPAAERNPLIRRIGEIHNRMLERGITNPQEAVGVATSSAEALRGALARLPQNASDEEKAAIVEELARAQRIRRLAAGQLPPEFGRIIVLDATTAEARALVGLNRIGEALTLLRGMAANTPAEIAIKAHALAPILALAERIHGFVPEADKATFGRLENLRAERKVLLEAWMAAEEDEDRIAAIALERAALGEALATLDAAIRRAPDNPILRGHRLVVQLGERPTEISRYVNEIPAELREAALAIAINTYGARGNIAGLDALRGLATTPGLAMQERLARIDALSRSPNEANDAEIDRLIAEGRAAPNAESFKDVLDAVEQARRSVRDLVIAANAENAPREGWTGLARQALAAGRLDIAEKVLEKELRNLAEHADRANFVRGVSEIVGLLNLVRVRAEDPALTQEQRNVARGFLERVGNQVVTALDGEIATSEVNVARQARNNWEASGSATDAQKKRAAERMQASLDDLRLMARLRGAARVASMPDAERGVELSRLGGEVGARITALEAEIRQQFSNLGRAVESGENRLRLEEKLGQLNALRAERDAYRDLVLARTGSQREYRYVLYNQVAKTNLEWELYDLDQRLNGTPATENERQTYGVRGRWRGASGWRKFGELAGTDQDRHFDKILLENETEYLEQRRFDLVMNAPHLPREQKRAMYEGILQREAGLWQAAGENVSPLLFPELTGLGQAEIALARMQRQAIEQMRLRNLENDYNEAVRRRDPQAAFDALVRIREASLAGEIDKYVDYLNIPWYRRGPVRGTRIGLYGEQTGATLEEMSADMSQLHSALIRAAHRPVNQLSPEDRTFLTERGFIVNGRYAIPEGITLRPTRAATELADEGRLAVVDKYVNAAFAAELAATVVIPGGLSARLAGTAFSRVALAEIIRREGAAVTARYLVSGAGARYIASWGAERALEAAFFTALSRGARTAIHPEMILDEKAWTLGSLSAEYLHNLAVISTLRVGGGAMGVGREALRRALGERVAGGIGEAAFGAVAGTATAIGEAALLTGLNRAFSANAITADDFIGNLLTIGMLRGMHMGGGQRGEGVTGRTRAEMEAYNRWLDAEFLPARRLINQFDGNWDALRAAYQKGTISENQMRQVFELRKRLIDELAREIVNELGGDVQAFGSSNLTSDYDLSFVGAKAELAVILFNARFHARWSRAAELGGSESATRLDVNFYTNPIFDAFRGGPDDVFHQDAFAHMAARKYMNDAQWAEHRARTLEATRPELRERLSAKFDEIEQVVRRATAEISALEAQIRAEMQRQAGEMRRIDEPDVGWAARNRLYENALREIIRLKEAYDRAPNEAARAEIAQQLRNAQSQALYFAAEAYQTDAAIKHVVFTIQAARRAITVESLMGSERPQTSIPLSEAQGRQSFFEQMANIYKEFNHHGNEFKLAGKTAKYFIRALDAARIAGIEFTPEMRSLVEATVHIDGIRGDAAAVEAYLKGKYGENGGQVYMDSVRRMLGQLGGQLAGRA